MTPDKRIEWCRENIKGFKAMHDSAEKARLETEENRKRMAALIAKKPAVAETNDGRPTLNRFRLASQGAAC